MCANVEHHKGSNFWDDFHRTPLHYAVRLNNFDATRKLLQKGTEVNVVDIFGGTPLSMACIDQPSLAMVKLLLQYDADINLERQSCMDLLLECGLNCKTQQQVTIIKMLIKNGKNINSTDTITNRSIMHIVALTGYVPLAEELLKMGGTLNIRDNFHCTPLTIATVHENFEVLKLFRTYNNRLI